MQVFPWSEQLAIDVGTAHVHIAVRGEGVVVREPSVVAFGDGRRQPVAVGSEARRLWERGVSEVKVVRPVRGGMVADFDAAVAMLRRFIRQALGHRPLFSPAVVAAYPAGATGVELQALRHSLAAAGAGHMTMVQKPLAASLGAGLPLHSDESYLVVDLGAGAVDIGVFSSGLVTAGQTVRYGGDDLNEALIRAVRRQQGLRITYTAAEHIKQQAGSEQRAPNSGVVPVDDVVIVEEGQRLDCYDIEVDDWVPQVLAEALEPLLDELTWVVEELPESSRRELELGGVVLTGGCTLLRGIEELFRERLQLPVTSAADPLSCTILGLETILNDLSTLSLNGRRFGTNSL